MPQFKSQREIENYLYKKPARRSWYSQHITQKWYFEGCKGLRPTERVVLITLWLRSGKKCESWVSYRRLAQDLGISKNTANKAIKILEKKGFIRIEKKIGQKGNYHRYLLLK